MKKGIRFIGANIIARIFIILGLTKRAKQKAIQGDFILSIYFHSPSKSLFEFCVKWLKKNRFEFLSQEDIISIANKKKPFPKGGIIITIDDGWQSNVENVVSIANKYTIPITIFVSSNPIECGNFWWSYIQHANKLKLSKISIESLKRVSNAERNKTLQDITDLLNLERRAMTVTQVINISRSKYVNIGSHTVSHPILVNCKDEEVKFELEESRQRIEEWIQKEVNCFAYPNGDYAEREIEYLKNAGYTSAYTTKPVYLTETGLQNIYQLPRFCIFENISKAEAICRILGVWQKYL